MVLIPTSFASPYSPGTRVAPNNRARPCVCNRNIISKLCSRAESVFNIERGAAFRLVHWNISLGGGGGVFLFLFLFVSMVVSVNKPMHGFDPISVRWSCWRMNCWKLLQSGGTVACAYLTCLLLAIHYESRPKRESHRMTDQICASSSSCFLG